MAEAFAAICRRYLSRLAQLQERHDLDGADPALQVAFSMDIFALYNKGLLF